MPYDFTYMWNVKNKQNRKKTPQRYREQMDGCLMEGICGDG